ncbi:putative NADPH-quinone reductase [Humitalea rosea]|uniref:Putative NADPH-quinone reductase n=1 Tax=Humitalea rosea TaxID=990373 RepID=A0A2W7IL08_9PROT|nr:NAD(P)H-dependent oxidoreductase [Humitalea rosea]PZW46637.1 putative NADPH-quinone reductase [Humitalea rosea]
MRVLLIYCHPRPDSYCAAQRDAVIAGLQAAGHVIERRDLYAEGFLATMTCEERGRYHDVPDNRQGIEDHTDSLRAAEALVLVYPTWWYGLPAMLKGWFDRVWAPGVAFAMSDGAIEPLLSDIRRIAVVTSYGSPLWLLWYVGWGDYKLMKRGVRRLCAKGCRLDWLYLHDMDRRQRPALTRHLDKVRAHFARW